jgi:TRAP-type C4-dicarboxylate transport system permease small subunit
MGIGAFFLVAMMLLIVANIIYRMTGNVIAGSFELSVLMIVITTAFALGYAGLEGSHVLVNIVVKRFPLRAQAIVDVLMSLIALAVWSIILWASFKILSDRWLTETTDLLSVPFLPFRFVWVFGLFLFCLVYLLQIIKSIRRAVKK